MSTGAVGSTTSAAATASTAASSSAMSGLSGTGETDFLKLLIAQLSNQNPLDSNSQNPQEFIAQLAQFEGLSATLKLNKTMEAYSLSSELTQSTALIGKNVTYTDASDQVKEGVATSVRVESGVCKILVGDTLVELSSITGVSEYGSGN
jgi:flagellar basal-body rod modification protein FlgD